MPRSVISISIFLASPSDVDPEREIVSQAIQEWNDIHSRNRGVHFELLRFERSVSAGFGTDGQDVINQQINDEYDLLISLFWKRLGSATPRAKSGTVEEYERAFERFKSNYPIDIAFLFKDAPINFRLEDLDQIRAVRDFETRVQASGALTKTFRDDQALRFELNLLLDRIARKHSCDGGGGSSAPTQPNRSSPMPSVSVPAAISEDSGGDEDERGLLDVTDDLTFHAEAAAQFLSEMSTELNSMTAVTNDVNAKMGEITKLRPIEPSETKPFITRIVDAMNNYSDFLDNRYPDYSNNTSLVIEDVRKMIDISYDFIDHNNYSFLNDVNSFRDTIIQMRDAMAKSRESYSDMMQSIQSLQRMTSALNKAKKRLTYKSSEFLEKMDSDLGLLDQAIGEVDILIALAKGG